MNSPFRITFVLLSLAGCFSLMHGGLVGSGRGKTGSLANLGIVNGQKSQKMKPYLASLREFGDHICGAAILDDSTILTAAHCLQKGFPANAYSVGVGDKVISGQTLYVVKEYINHKGYDKVIDYNNDVAIIRLEEKIKMPNKALVAPIKFVENCAEGLPYSQKAFVAGWGAQKEKDQPVADLFETTVYVLKNSDPGCSTYANEDKLSETMFCAGFANSTTDSCQGDSGGPLVNKYSELIGIVSWGRGCNRQGLSGVYTNVCKMVKWINDTWHKKC